MNYILGIIIACMFYAGNCYGQKQLDNYEITYTFYRNLGHPVQDDWKLYLDDKNSLFVIDSQLEYLSQKNPNTTTNLTSTKDKIIAHLYKDFTTDSIFSQGRAFKTSYYIQDTLLDPQWEIVDETKEISGYNCQKALTTFRGRDYITWFTPDIPLQAGPWKLQGLPGLILYAEDITGSIKFIAKTMKTNTPKTAKDVYNSLPKYGDNVSLREYIVEKDKEALQFLKSIMAKSSRSTLSFETTGRSNALEITYEWEH